MMQICQYILARNNDIRRSACLHSKCNVHRAKNMIKTTFTLILLQDIRGNCGAMVPVSNPTTYSPPPNFIRETGQMVRDTLCSVEWVYTLSVKSGSRIGCKQLHT